jgi:predicted DNA-binding transcriptional regulator AlpA
MSTSLSAAGAPSQDPLVIRRAKSRKRKRRRARSRKKSMDNIKPFGNSSAMEPLLDPKEAATVLKVSTSWLAKARVQGDGPEFVKIGRAVRYPESSLHKFIAQRTRTSTNVE